MSLSADLKRFSDYLSDCPNPQKKVFDSADGARYAALDIGGMNYYKCVCGKWHLTTRVECPFCLDDPRECGCVNEIHFGDS